MKRRGGSYVVKGGETVLVQRTQRQGEAEAPKKDSPQRHEDTKDGAKKAGAKK